MEFGGCYQKVLPKIQQNRISTHDNSFQSEQSCHGRQIQMKKQYPSFSRINDPTQVENIICLSAAFTANIVLSGIISN